MLSFIAAPLKELIEREVIRDPIYDRERKEFRESGRDEILLGITSSPKNCFGKCNKNTTKDTM